MKIFILGATGLIGNNIFNYLSDNTSHQVFGSYRNSLASNKFSKAIPEKLIHFNLQESISDLNEILIKLHPDVVINALGITKHIGDSMENIIRVNSLFPHQLAKISTDLGIRLIHISTDCVFSGSRGMYSEYDVPDSVDLYGRSKALGEVVCDNHLTVRISTIGRELITKHGLLEWFLMSEEDCLGYKKAIFSGIPSKYFANILNNLILPNPEIVGLYHISSQPIDKFTLLQILARFYNKKIQIISNEEFVIDRSLDSSSFSNKTGFVAPSWNELISTEWL